LYAAAKAIGIPVDWLATVISFETGGTFSPSVQNKAGSGATGLIQFMPSTAAALLKVKDPQLARFMTSRMSFKEQLTKMVVPYFKGGTYKSLDDVYLKVFYPAAMNKPKDHVVGTAPSPVYSQNAGFDRDSKGYITKGDITRTINGVFDRAILLPPIIITVAIWGQVLAGLAVAAGAVYALQSKKLL
jgi:hypothetical protein